MNNQIVKLFGLVAILFTTLIAFTSYWSVLDAHSLETNTANRRPLLEQLRVRRGSITAADGTVLARSRSTGSGSSRIFSRSYPDPQLAPHVVGYSFIERGQAGVERQYNGPLLGERDDLSSIIDELRGRRNEGDDVRLSIDPGAQRAAASALGANKGSVVALDPTTGRIRVMVSEPEFDPNQVRDDFASLNRSPGEPLFDRATQSGYVPGSTFKVVTAAAALDSGKFTPSSVLSGKTGIKISGVPLSNFSGENFGNVDLTTALTHSINTVWAQVGVKLGPQTMYEYMSRFGFDAKPPIDFPKDQLAVSGVYGNSGRRLLGPGDGVDIGRVAIGQERLRVTPLQMAMVAATVANGGELMRPRLVEKVTDPDGRKVDDHGPKSFRRVMSEKAASQLRAMMGNVVKEGTGTAAALQGIEVGGKTGTAEVGGGLNQAWFIGFAPLDRPRVAVAVTIERTSGQGGVVAAPIAKTVMEHLLGRAG